MKNLVKYFNAEVADENYAQNFEEVNKIAVLHGFIVEPCACSPSVIEFLKDNTIDYNATFYKDWNDIIIKNRFELFVDQLFHYATTYGSDFEGEAYIPNTGAENVPVMSLDNLKVIRAISKSEMVEKCMSMIKSGIALKSEVVNDVCTYIAESVENTNDIDIDSIKNLEAQATLCNMLNVRPSDKFGLLRYIMYVTTGKAMLIKDKATIDSIIAGKTYDWGSLTEKELTMLSSIFLRFKPLFLAFKHNSCKNASIINKLRKLAKKNHKPMETPFWNNVLSVEHTDEEIMKNLEKITNFKKITILNTIKERLSFLEDNVYVIRNGNAFVKENTNNINADNIVKLVHISEIIYNNLVDSLRDKACYVKFPQNINIACPTSEKNFVGNYPSGTSIKLKENSVIGIYWRKEWGAQDLDLHAYDVKGQHIGWNSEYCDDYKNIIFSGDMTKAEPEATEAFLIKDGCENMSINVNNFYGETNPKLKLFVATEENPINIKRGYMVDPNSVLLSVETDMESKKERTFGYVVDNTFVLSNVSTGNNIVCRNQDLKVRMTENKMKKAPITYMLKDVLLSAGFKEYTDDVELTENDKLIDLTNLDKTTLIDLFK